MNKQIKELMAQTLDDKFSHTWTTMTYEDLTKFSDKFAELIVAECVKLCEHDCNDDEYDQYDMGQSVKAENIKTSIKQHFGVEE